MKKGTCIRFNGIQNEACNIGIKYLDVAAPLTQEQIEWHNENYPELPADRTAIGNRIPCFLENCAGHCSDYCEPTKAEIEQNEIEINQAIDRILKAHKAVADHLAAIGAPRGTRGMITCPVCGDGALQFSRAAYNGHIAARCSTDKCVEFTE